MKRLSGWDAVLLYSEAPNVHMHTIKVAVIELDPASRGFTIEAFRQVIAGRMDKLVPLGYQLIDVPYKFHHPMWRENCEVDFEYHIRPWQLPAPGGRRELDEAIGQIASTPLDRAHPLWEMYFVEGLANDRIAVVLKIHHALADGVASANLMAHGMDLHADTAGSSYTPDPAPTKRELMGSAFVDHLRHIKRIPATIRYTAQGVGRVRRSSRKLSPELTMPFTPPPTFMNHMLTPERSFATATLALADVKATGKKLGATINDMVLAMSSGALRSLLLRYDGQAVPLLASVPVSYDFSPERISGNYFSGMMVALPTDLADPLERVRAAHDNAASAKESHQLAGAGAGQPLGRVLAAGGYRSLVPVVVQPRRAEQGPQPEHLQCPRSPRTRPGGRRAGHRDLFGGAADGGQWLEHHRVELRRSTQHLGADRRCHPQGPA